MIQAPHPGRLPGPRPVDPRAQRQGLPASENRRTDREARPLAKRWLGSSLAGSFSALGFFPKNDASKRPQEIRV